MDSILVPVRPHVLKYVAFHVGKHYFLSESDQFGLFLFALLRRPLSDARRDHVLETYPGKWEVNLGSYGCGHRGFRDLTGKSVLQFNTFVHAIILTEMYGFVESALDHGQQAKFAIEGFMLKYGFGEEDIQFATLQKAWTRYWKNRKESKRKVQSLSGRLAVKELESRLKKLPVAAFAPAQHLSISAQR